MKTFIQLAIAGLIMNACFQTARTFWDYYEFKDEIQQEALHGRGTTTSQLHQRVLDIGAEHGIELTWGDVKVGSEQQLTTIDVTYMQAIPLVPKLYSRSWPFTAAVSARRIRPLTIDDLR